MCAQAPSELTITELKDDQYLCSEQNVNIMGSNVDAMKAQIMLQKTELGCYHRFMKSYNEAVEKVAEARDK